MNIFAIIFGTLYLASSCTSLRPFLLPYPQKVVESSSGDAGEPLILTPLINAGRISEARKLSEVSLMTKVKGNAGFLTVNETYNSNLYFWFFQKTSTDWTQAPLILWLQGGPGCSSIFGLFVENGPFLVKKSHLRRRKYAWTNRYNVLYIDQPVGSGFSFTDDKKGYISTQEEVGQHLYEALRQFYKLYPELTKNDFYISGESYAGKYIPALAYEIHQRNLQSGKNKVPMKGLFIGNGWSDPVNMLGYAEYLYRLGLVDLRTKREAEIVQEEVRALIRSHLWRNASIRSDELYDMLEKAMSYISPYDYTKNDDEEDIAFLKYLERADVRKAIHVGRRSFETCSTEVYEHFMPDIMKSVRPWIEELLEHYPIMFYSGQLDIIVAYPLTENFLQNLEWSAADEYSKAERKIWLVEDHVAGYYKNGGNLIEVLVRNAGHMVPMDQPKNALNLLVRFVEAK